MSFGFGITPDIAGTIFSVTKITCKMFFVCLVGQSVQIDVQLHRSPAFVAFSHVLVFRFTLYRESRPKCKVSETTPGNRCKSVFSFLCESASV